MESPTQAINQPLDEGIEILNLDDIKEQDAGDVVNAPGSHSNYVANERLSSEANIDVGLPKKTKRSSRSMPKKKTRT